MRERNADNVSVMVHSNFVPYSSRRTWTKRGKKRYLFNIKEAQRWVYKRLANHGIAILKFHKFTRKILIRQFRNRQIKIPVYQMSVLTLIPKRRLTDIEAVLKRGWGTLKCCGYGGIRLSFKVSPTTGES